MANISAVSGVQLDSHPRVSFVKKGLFFDNPYGIGRQEASHIQNGFDKQRPFL
jgi:hypothetical protein